MTIIVLDIETIPKYLPDLEDELTKTVKAPSNWKDADKIEAFKKEKIEKELNTVQFDPDGADVVCVGLGVINPQEMDIEHIESKCSPITDELCKFFCDYLNKHRATKLVGCNIEGFDIPILMSAVARTPYYVTKPIAKWGIVDLMHIQKRKDNVTRRVKGTWNSLCRLYGVDEPSKDGSMVKEMWEQEDYKGIADYCCEDVRAEGELYLRMSRFIEL
jgi:predicted PolB exonuclease-like 3'-5' exonuclease